MYEKFIIDEDELISALIKIAHPDKSKMKDPNIQKTSLIMLWKLIEIEAG